MNIYSKPEHPTLLSWVGTIFIIIENAAMDEIFRLGAALDLMLQVVSPHMLFQLTRMGLESRGSGGRWEDVFYL